MSLKKVADDWKNRLNKLQLHLVELDNKQKEIQKALKESELGKQQVEIRKEKRTLKKMIELQKHEISGLDKAIKLMGDAPSNESHVFEPKVYAIGG